jgi:hypothetical protein
MPHVHLLPVTVSIFSFSYKNNRHAGLRAHAMPLWPHLI